MGLFDQSEQFADGLNTFRFADEGGLVAARRRGIQDHLAGPLRLIPPRGEITGEGDINLTGDINLVGGIVATGNIAGAGTGTVSGKLTGQRLHVNLSGTNPLPTLLGGLDPTPNVTAEVGDHNQGSVLFGSNILGEPEVQSQRLNVTTKLHLNPQGGYVTHGGEEFRHGQWTTFAPPVTQQNALTFAADGASGGCRWTRLGRTIIYHGALIYSSGTGVAGQPVRVGLPVAAATIPGATNSPCGTAYVYDASTAAFHVGVACFWDADEIGFFQGGSIGGGVWMGTHGFTAALTTTDRIRFSVIYEAAS